MIMTFYFRNLTYNNFFCSFYRMWQGISDPHKVKIISGALVETAAAHTIQINFIAMNEVTFFQQI